MQIRKNLGLKLNEILQESNTSKRSKASSLTSTKGSHGRLSRWENRLEDVTRR